jgi:hypothetical protein
MLKLIGTLMVTGFVLVGTIASMSGDWDNALGYLWGALGSGAIFTLIWVITTYQMKEMLGNKKRSEVPDHIVGASIAVLALIGCLGFVMAGISAGCAHKWPEAHELLWSGTACGGVLSIIWCVSEYYFVNSNK